jgi:hypothetical protein
MRIANQLFDRSSLNPAKKDTKLTVDKQAAVGTATSIPKKVIDLFFLRLTSRKYREFSSFEEKKTFFTIT